MHILLIHQAFATVNEAGGTRHYEMAKYFISQGHKVTIISSQINYLTGKKIQLGENKYQQIKNLEIIRTYTYPAFHKSFFHRLIGFFSFMASSFIAGIRVKKVDLVWGTSPPIFQGWTAWLLSFLKNKPFLFEVRDLWPAFAVAVGVLNNKIIIMLSETLEKFLYNRAACVVVNSPGYIEHVSQRGSKRTELIPNGADINMFQNKVESNYFEKSMIDGKFIVLYAGAHGLSNDLKIVLDAASQLRENKKIHFVFVGDGKEKANLIIYANQLKLENISWIASVPKEEMGGILSRADVGLAILKPIELYKTTYPNKVFDYMAAGLPVLLVIDGVIREVVEKAKAGIFAEPGNVDDIVNKINYLYDDKEKLSIFARNGQNYIRENFSREKLSKDLLKIMEEL